MWVFLLANFRFLFLSAGLLAAVYGTWQIQDWRYAAREVQSLKAQQEFIKRETRKHIEASIKFEKKQEQLNEIYKQINRALGEVASNTLCFDPERLRLLNAALARAAANLAGPDGAVP